MKKLLPLVILPTILLADQFNIKTFGTIGGVYNDNDNFYFRKDTLHKDGASGDLDYNTDTVLGVQPSYTINDDFSILMQGVYQRDYKDEYKPTIDWGYLKYNTSSNATLKVGRIRNHFYQNSENLNIGYSTLKVREHIELYGQVPNTGFNGVSFSYSDLIGKYFYDLQLSYGNEKFVAPIHSIPEEVDITLDDLIISNFTFGTPEYQLRLTYLNADISAKSPMLNQLFTGLRNTGLPNEFNQLANEYDLTHRDSTYAGAGIFIDKDDFILATEYGYRKVPGFYVDISSYYATAGYRLDNLIPYTSYAKSKMDQNLKIDTSSDILDLKAGLNKVLSVQNVAQETKTLGLKYFINENLDLKVQYDHITPLGEDGGAFVRTDKDYHGNSSLNVLSFALDFVY